MTKNYDVIIIGGGITGLTAALHLTRENVKVALVEESNRLGGQIQSFSKEGFTFESGPNTGVLNAIEVVELFDLVSSNCDIEIAHQEAKKRLILHKGTFKALPKSLVTAIATPLFSFSDKFRLLFEPFRSRGKDINETMGDFVTRRLGKTFVDYALDPFVSGIYAGDVSKLIVRFAFPKLYNLENKYGSFIKGAIKLGPVIKEQRRQGVTKDVFSVNKGLESLPKAIIESIKDKIDIYCEAEMCEIRKDNSSGVLNVTFSKDKETILLNAKNVVTTTGAYTLPTLLPDINSDLLNPIASLFYAGVVEIAVGYNNFPKKLDAFGGLIPSKENRSILGVLFPSACFDNRAPKGGALLSVFMGGTKRPEILNFSDDEILKIVLEEIKHSMDVDQKPDLVEIFRHSKAIPQYYASTQQRYEAITEVEKQMDGLIIGGNLKDGIGLSDRIKQGRNMAKIVVEKLDRK